MESGAIIVMLLLVSYSPSWLMEILACVVSLVHNEDKWMDFLMIIFHFTISDSPSVPPAIPDGIAKAYGIVLAIFSHIMTISYIYLFICIINRLQKNTFTTVFSVVY